MARAGWGRAGAASSSRASRGAARAWRGLRGAPARPVRSRGGTARPAPAAPSLLSAGLYCWAPAPARSVSGAPATWRTQKIDPSPNSPGSRALRGCRTASSLLPNPRRGSGGLWDSLARPSRPLPTTDKEPGQVRRPSRALQERLCPRRIAVGARAGPGATAAKRGLGRARDAPASSLLLSSLPVGAPLPRDRFR